MSKTSKFRLAPAEPTQSASVRIDEALKRKELSVHGQAVELFTEALQNYTHSPTILLTNSGTSAIHLALLCLGVGKGDDVICSSFSYVASANPIVYCDATPIFIDSEELSWNLDTGLLEEYLESCVRKGKKLPKAVLAVHSYGMPCKLDKLLDLKDRFGFYLIEDAAAGLGSAYRQDPIGTFGDAGIFSFNGNKIITSSGGGALLLRNQKHFQTAKTFASQSREQVNWYEHKSIGYNYLMGNINAALGLSQFEDISSRIDQKRLICMQYQELLHDVNVSFQVEPEDAYSNRWLTCAVFSDKEVRESIEINFKEAAIETRRLWNPLHKQPVFKDCRFIGSDSSEKLFARGLCLPSGLSLSRDGQRIITQHIQKSLFPDV